MVGPPGCFWVGVQLGAGLVGEQAALGFGKLIRVQEWSWERGRICIKSIYIMLFTNYTSQEAAGWQKGEGRTVGRCLGGPVRGGGVRPLPHPLGQWLELSLQCHWPSAAHAVTTNSELQSPQNLKGLLESGSPWLKTWGSLLPEHQPPPP